MNNNVICDVCGKTMQPGTVEQKFVSNGKEMLIKGLDAYICKDCNNILYTPETVKMIEKLFDVLESKPAIDVLNLDETANYLRVSNQTIYNMIRDGRIKAYKVGREWRFLRADITSYLNESVNDSIKLAAKGGTISKRDKKTIQEEIERRQND